MPKRFIQVLESLSAPPRADFMFAAVNSGQFKTRELVDLFGADSMEATLTLALAYIDAGSILVMSSRRESYARLLAEVAAARAGLASGQAMLPP